MKTTKRSKMLLSSIAMLLVALVALGSASFAWYSVQTTVTAEQSQFSASAASGLVIRHEDDNFSGTNAAKEKAWTTALNATNQNALKTVESLPPRAITLYNNGNGIAYSAVKGASATATSRESYAATIHQLIDNVPSDNGYLIDHMFVAGEAGEVNVDMTIAGTAAAAGEYLNIAVYIGGNLEGVFTFDGDDDSATRDLAVTGSTASEGAAYTPTKFSGINTYQTVKSNFQIAGKASGGTEIKIIGYADGFNDNCTSSTYKTDTLSVKYSFNIHS